MHAIDATLEALNVQVALGEIDLAPMQIDGLCHPQAMPSHDEDQAGIALPIAADFKKRKAASPGGISSHIAAINNQAVALSFRFLRQQSPMSALTFSTLAVNTRSWTLRGI